MIKNCIISLCIYPYDVMVSIGETDDEFRKSVLKIGKNILKELEDPVFDIFNFAENHNGRTAHLQGGQTIIRMPHKIAGCELHGTLAHEIFHSVEIIFERIGMKLTRESAESYAYTIGYITKEIYAKFKLTK